MQGNKLLLSLLFSTIAAAQTSITPLDISSGSFGDLSNVTTGTTPTATCTADVDFYIDTDARRGSKFLHCCATNTWCGLDNISFNVVDYGADPTGAADSTTAIVAALAACETEEIGGSVGAGIIYFPGGEFDINATLDWSGCSWQGTLATEGTRILWNGSAGGTMVDKVDQTSHGFIKDIEFQNGTAIPATFIDFTVAGTRMDSLLTLENVRFRGASGDALVIASWFGLYFNRLRFDEIDGWAIRLTPVAQNSSIFHLDNFYIDSNIGSTAPGFILVDNTADSGFLGLFHLSNGIIENNVDWTGNEAVVELITPNTGANSNSLQFIFSNIVYKDGNTSSPNDVLFYRNTTDTTETERVSFENIKTTNLSAVFGGTWPANYPLPTLPGDDSMGDFSTAQSIVMADNVQFTLQPRSATSHALRVKEDDDADYTWTLGTDGALDFGDGTNAPDITLSRSAANTLRVENGTTTKFIVQGGDTQTGINLQEWRSNSGFLAGVDNLGRFSAARGGNVDLCLKYTKDFADLTTAAATEDETLVTTYTRTRITGISVKASTAFSGGSLSAMTVSVGDSNSDTEFSTAFDIFAAVSDTNIQDTDQFHGRTQATNAIHAHFIATDDTMDNVSAGSVDIWVCSVRLP